MLQAEVHAEAQTELQAEVLAEVQAKVSGKMLTDEVRGEKRATVACTDWLSVVWLALRRSLLPACTHTRTHTLGRHTS